MNIFVSGNHGFVGRHLVTYLNQTGAFNVLTTDDNTRRRDITELSQLKDIEPAQAVIHLASKTSLVDSLSNPYLTYYTNILGTLTMLEYARIKNIPKFIFISTYIYGHPLYLPIDENHPVKPHSPYSKSKMFAERECEEYCGDYGIDMVVLRPFYLYGPHSKPNSFIPSVMRQLRENNIVTLSGIDIKRDFLYVIDFVELITAVLRDFPKGFNVYNVGYGSSYSLEEVIRKISNLLRIKRIPVEYDSSVRPNDIQDMVANIAKVSKEFRWEPRIDLDIGLRLTLDTYLKAYYAKSFNQL